MQLFYYEGFWVSILTQSCTSWYCPERKKERERVRLLSSLVPFVFSLGFVDDDKPLPEAKFHRLQSVNVEVGCCLLVPQYRTIFLWVSKYWLKSQKILGWLKVYFINLDSDISFGITFDVHKLQKKYFFFKRKPSFPTQLWWCWRDFAINTIWNSRQDKIGDCSHHGCSKSIIKTVIWSSLMGRIMCTTMVYYKRIKENCRWNMNFRIKFALQGVVWRDWGGCILGGVDGYSHSHLENVLKMIKQVIQNLFVFPAFLLPMPCVSLKNVFVWHKNLHTSLLNIPFFGDFILPFNGVFFQKWAWN